MDKQAKARQKAGQDGKQGKRGRGAKQLVIDEDRVITTPHPEGSRFRGYEDFVVQDLVVKQLVVRYRRERWETPDGQRLVAPLPSGLRGHFGPELHRFVLATCHQGQTTVERLLALLCDFGVVISRRQLVRLLTEGQEAFVAEAEAVLRSGLESARWVSVDDTGARHQARNGYTTQIGNDHFTWFATTFSRSRLNFLELLCAGHRDYVINQKALACMKDRNLPAGATALLAQARERNFTSRSAFLDHLQALGLTSPEEARPDLVRIAQEGALRGTIAHHGLLQDCVILSDGPCQFKLDPFTDREHRDKEHIRKRLWWLYASLKSYRQTPTRRRRAELRQRFSRIFTTRTGSATLDRLLARLHTDKEDLLCVLDRPEVPLHTNQTENDIRCQVTRRKISGGTRSRHGKEAKDALLSIKKTCKKLGISFRDYLGDRLPVPQAPPIDDLAEIVRMRQSTTA